MAAGDAIVPWMGRAAEVNTFVLVFAALTVVVSIVGKIMFAMRKKRTAG